MGSDGRSGGGAPAAARMGARYDRFCTGWMFEIDYAVRRSCPAWRCLIPSVFQTGCIGWWKLQSRKVYSESWLQR